MIESQQNELNKANGTIARLRDDIEKKDKEMLDYEKSLGKTSMRKLLLKGGDLQVFQFKTEDMKKVEKMAKKYGVLYSVLPDCNRSDGLSEIIFHTEAVPRVNMMAQKLQYGKLATFDDYLKNGDEKQLGKLMEFLKKQGNEKSHTIEDEHVNSAIDGLIEKVGLFAMEKQAISVDQVKENFSINGEQAENVIKQLETIGVLGKKDADGTHKVMMDKDAFINRVKQKAKIHSHEPKTAKIKGGNVYTTQRGPKTASDRASAMNGGKKNYRKATVHQEQVKEKGLSRFKQSIRESNASIKTKDTKLHVAGRTGALAAGAATEQVEGGKEVTQAAYAA